MIPIWAADYIGLPYGDKGRGPEYDCWGLVWLVYREVFAIDLPKYDELYFDSKHGQSIQALINEEIVNWQPIDVPEEGCLIIFRVLGWRMHTGIGLDSRNFLHAFHGTDSCIEELTSTTWNKRIEGCWRYV